MSLGVACGLLTFADVLSMLRGKIGRNWLLAHLASTPEHGGRPTHRRIGRKIMFAPGDVQCLLESLPECPSRSSSGKGPERCTNRTEFGGGSHP